MIRSQRLSQATIWGALLLLALSSVHTKTAGALWLFGFFSAALIGIRSRPWDEPDLVDRAAWVVLAGMTAAWMLWIFTAAYWGELIHQQSAEINSGSRLFTGALALWCLVRARAFTAGKTVNAINLAVSIACALAFALAALSGRGNLPSNAIAWACGIALLVCVLLPWALAETQSRAMRLVCAAGAAFGLGAVLASQSRSAYPVIAWALALIILMMASRASWTARRKIFALGISALVSVLIALSATLASDPLRLRVAWTEIEVARTNENFNSSVGARYYLLKLGWTTFAQSPWIGVGATHRKAIIQAAGTEGVPERAGLTEHVRELKHVHNAYLHHAMDGGLISLTGFMLTIAALVLAGWRLHKRLPVSAWQLWGLAFVHATSNLSSVNLAHNYYALMLALTAALVLVQARASLRTARPTPA